MMNENRMIRIGAVTLLLAVILGAFGAHTLKEVLTEDQILSYKTGVLYQMIHGVAILFLGLLYRIEKSRWLIRAFYFFLVGIILFSGSIYLLVNMKTLQFLNTAWVGPLTPIGGICFILGWGSVVISTYKK